MDILWLGKRFYTNTDTLSERFGRMYQFPCYWHKAGQKVQLWLIDYHTREVKHMRDAGMPVVSSPVFSLATIKQLLRTIVSVRPRCIVASGDCYIGLLGWLLARMCAASFVFDIYDKYDEFSGYRRIAGFDPLSFLVRHSDGLMFASTSLAHKLGSGARHAPHVAPNGIDPGMFKPMKMSECRDRLGLPADAILVGYFGSMEADRGVADLIGAVDRLRNSNVPVELLLAGRMDDGPSLNHPWIRYLGLVPHAQIPQLLNACDLLVLPYRTGPFMDMVSSCKIAEYLACERPLVATDAPSFVLNFAEQAAALGPALCRMSDPADMARALEFQLRIKKILPPPQDMTWQSIAEDSLRWLHQCGAVGAG